MLVIIQGGDDIYGCTKGIAEFFEGREDSQTRFHQKRNRTFSLDLCLSARILFPNIDHGRGIDRIGAAASLGLKVERPLDLFGKRLPGLFRKIPEPIQGLHAHRFIAIENFKRVLIRINFAGAEILHRNNGTGEFQ